MLGLGRVRGVRRCLPKPACRHYIRVYDQGPGSLKDTAGLDVQILGSAAKCPTPAASCPAIGLRVDSHQWLFDCGEGTQKQMSMSRMMRLRALRGICITHMHGDHVLGLPGMVLNALTLDLDRRLPSLYGPEGLYNFLTMVLKLCETRNGLLNHGGLTIHELLDCEEGEEESRRNALPAFHRRQPDFKLSNVHYKGIPRDADGFWTIERNDKYVIRAGRIEHSVPTFGYVVHEHEQRGKLDVAKAMSLGLEPGPLYKALTEGRDVTRPDGSVVRAADVMSAPRPGRKVTILGDTSDAYAMAPLAMDSDLLVHEATLEASQERRAVARGHSTSVMAAKFAKHINARHLVLNHISNRYRRSCLSPDSSQHVWDEGEGKEKQLVEEAEAVLGQGRVTAARDLLVLQLGRRGEALATAQLQQEEAEEAAVGEAAVEEEEREEREEQVAASSSPAAVADSASPPAAAAADHLPPPPPNRRISRLWESLCRSTSSSSGALHGVGDSSGAAASVELGRASSGRAGPRLPVVRARAIPR